MSEHLSSLQAEVGGLLADADAALAARYPGSRGDRQPVHTVYVPADRVTPATPGQWSAQALAALQEHAPDDEGLATAFGTPAELAESIRRKIVAKLTAEPIEDLRVDFEDGYGRRPDAEEDADADRASATIAELLGSPGGPLRCGIRFACLEAATRDRGLRTLDRVVGGLGGRVPAGFVLTLPKVTSVEQVSAMVRICERLEAVHRLPAGALRFEIQVETPQAILSADGVATVAPMIHAAAGRCSALHYGTYDYSASVGIAAEYQSMEHPAADHAKNVMQVAAAGTGVELSDGSTNIVPVGDADQVVAAWQLHSRLVRRHLERGYYQGWDLHPAQLPSRYAAVYGFYLAGLSRATTRLRSYLQRADSGFMDEPATALALAGFVLRAVDCGAVDGPSAAEVAGTDELGLRRLARRP